MPPDRDVAPFIFDAPSDNIRRTCRFHHSKNKRDTDPQMNGGEMIGVQLIKVDVIMAVFNAEATVEASVRSAMHLYHNHY